MSENLANKLVSCSDVELDKLVKLAQGEQLVRAENKKKEERPWTDAEWDRLIQLRNSVPAGEEEDFEISKKLQCKLTCTVRIAYDYEDLDFEMCYEEINPPFVTDIDFEELPQIKKFFAKIEAAKDKYEAEVRRLSNKYNISDITIQEAVAWVY